MEKIGKVTSKRIKLCQKTRKIKRKGKEYTQTIYTDSKESLRKLMVEFK